MSKPAPEISPALIEWTLAAACAIQSIPAPTFQESQRAAYLLQELNHLGLKDVQLDAVGNVLGRLSANIPDQAAGKRPLVISAHMDTVFPLETPLHLRRSEERIIGPGIGDNALGQAALLGLVRLLQEPQVIRHGDLWLAFNIGEEGLGDLRGIQAVVERFGGEPLAYLVIEGMGLGTILHRGLGVERYKISVHTLGGHSWVDYGEPSAVHELCKIVTQLAALKLPRQPCTTLNVGMIQGGTSVNTIAARAWLELDLRSEDSDILAELVWKVEEITSAAKGQGVDVRLERIGRRLAGMIPQGHPLVELGREVLKDLGLEAHLDIASTDANLPLSQGYPAICVGVTNGNNAHTQEEYILTAPLAQGLAQLYQLVTRCWEKLT